MMQSSCLIKILIELHVSMNLKFIWGKLLCSFGESSCFNCHISCQIHRSLLPWLLAEACELAGCVLISD
uniref:Uncharacterized protein n=1 Tax=Anguilla anguilla TaxID=7936 RepID=A0A0E9U4X6_ANGAN